MGGRVELRARETRLYSVSKTLVNMPEYWTRNRDRIAVHRAKALVVDTYLFEAAAQDISGVRSTSARRSLSWANRFERSAVARSIVGGSRKRPERPLHRGIADVIDAMTFEI